MDDAQTLTTPGPSGPVRPPAGEPPAPPAASPPEAPRTFPPSAESPPFPSPAEPPLSELEFTGCKAVPMTYEQFQRYDGRLEVWDAEAETAWMVREPTSADHELPSQGLAGLTALVAAVRGSPIACYGSMDLLVQDAQGRRGGRGLPRRIMQADQTVYLKPSRAELSDAGTMVVGRHSYPDVVLEVDHTTDVRRGKLVLYEAWGFPELWVEVPQRRVASRPRRLAPGLTIHVLEEGAYRVSPESRAFPGWTAEAIHEAMNEAKRSVRTSRLLEELGRRLGARDGTGPDDDSLMRSLRSQSRAEGKRKGRAEGLAEGLAEGERKGRVEGLAEGERKGRVDVLAKVARRMLRSRGVEVSEGFLADPAFAASSEDAVFEAASACTDEAQFLAALQDGARSLRDGARSLRDGARSLRDGARD